MQRLPLVLLESRMLEVPSSVIVVLVLILVDEKPQDPVMFRLLCDVLLPPT